MATLHVCDSLHEANQLILSKLEPVLSVLNAKYTLALAGGNTPKALYREMSQKPWSWSNVQVTLTDERWVSTDSADSNEKMINDCLLINEAKISYFLPLKNSATTASEGQQECETQLATLMPKLDGVILGMGDDGHIASIFPDLESTTTLLDRDSSALCMAASPKDLPERMSLSLAYLLTADHITILCSGKQKRLILDEVTQGKGSRYPVFHIVNQHSVPVDIYWSPAS